MAEETNTNAEETSAKTVDRNLRKVRVGIVSSNKMDKTITDQVNGWPWIANGHVESIGWLDSEELISQEAIGIRSGMFWTHFSGPKDRGREWAGRSSYRP